MSLSVLESVWKIMKDMNLKFVPDIPSSLMCQICKHILIDPYKSYCGCKFCFECVNEMLNNDKNSCPGDKKNCSEKALKIDITVVKDFDTSKNILSVSVKCPNVDCNLVLNLGEFVTHISNCERKLVLCPYQSIGCTNDINTGKDISEHLHTDAYFHSQLLIDTINNFQNAIKIYGQSSGLTSKKVTEETVDHSIVRELNEINIKLFKLEEENINLRKENDTNRGEICHLRHEIETLNNCLRSANLMHDFDWKIEDFSKKQGQFYDSTSFSKDNYRLGLQAWIDGHNIHLYFLILKGECDDFLEWPLKYTIVLSILNQYTLCAYKSSKYSLETYSGNKASFKRPTNNQNDGIGGLKVSRYEINSTHGLLCLDSVLVSCSLII